MDKRPLIFHSAIHELAFCFVIISAQLLTQAAVGNVINTLHIIGPDLGVPNTESGNATLPWFSAAYSVTVGAFIAITGRLGDVYGHKLLFTAGYLWFALFSLLLGFAPYVTSQPVIYFIILRALQGIGPATILPNGIALLARAYPNGKRKTFVFAMFGAAAPNGWIVGATFAALFGQLVWWPWAMWVLAMVCFILALLAFFIVVPDDIGGPVAPDEDVDVWGAIAGVSALIIIVYAWNEGPVAGWDQPYVYVLLIIGIALVALFVWIEARSPEPIMPLDMWTAKGFPGMIIAIGLGWSSFGIWNYYSVQLIQIFRNGTALLTAAETVPVGFAGLTATISLSILIHHTKIHYILTFALVAFCIGNILIAICTISSTYWTYIFLSMCITPFGMDLSYPAGLLIVSNSLPKERQGAGASMINTVVNVSISLGLGIAGTVQSRLLSGGASDLSAQRAAVYVGIALSGIGILVAFLFARPPAHNEKKDKEEGGEETTQKDSNTNNDIPLQEIQQDKQQTISPTDEPNIVAPDTHSVDMTETQLSNTNAISGDTSPGSGDIKPSPLQGV